MGRMWISCIVEALLLAGLGTAQGEKREPDPNGLIAVQIGQISPLEAMHLLERHNPDLVVENVETLRSANGPQYVLRGSLGGDRYSAWVDAERARLLRVEKNGQDLWRWDGIKVVAHRGAANFGPENTLGAFEKATELGADYIELDVRQTRDGHFVIMHDDTVDRTTDGTGAVADLTLADIRRLDAGAWHAPEHAGNRVPTLQEVIEALRGRAGLNLDFKAGSPEALVSILREEEAVTPGFIEHTTFNSHTPELLRKVLELEPRLLARPILQHGRAGLSTLLDRYDPDLVNINASDLTAALVRDVHLAGKKAFVSILGKYDCAWGMRLAVACGADYIQTDHLDVLVPILRDEGVHR